MATQGQSEKLRLGKVIGNTVAFIGRNTIFLLAIGALFFVLPGVLVSLAGFWYWSRLPLGGHWANGAFTLASGLLAIAPNFLGCVVLSKAAIDDIKGNRPSVVGCIQAVPRHSLAIVGAGLAVYLALFLTSDAGLRAGLLTPSEAFASFVVLIAPFIPWGLGISVAVPVTMQEGVGIGASMTRSRALTKGHRRPIFGLFLIAVVLFFVRQVGLALAFGVVSTALAPVSALIVEVLLNALVWAMIWMVASTAITVTYVELRRIKEGGSVDELSEVFS